LSARAALENLYHHDHVTATTPSLASGGDDEAAPELPAPFVSLIKKIYDGGAEPIDTGTAIHMAKNFTEAIEKGLTDVGYDYDIPDPKLFEALQQNAYHFSAAKSYEVNKQLTELINKTNSFHEFEKAARTELHLYLGQYGRIEYNSAYSASQMAAKWETFRQNAAIMPYLQYKTSRSERVCPICAPYDNIILLKTNPFWNWGSPLRHFQCGCTLLELPGDDLKETEKDQFPDPSLTQELFRTNYPAKGLAFPPGHPYYKDVPRKSLKHWLSENAPPPLQPSAPSPDIKAQRTEILEWARKNICKKNYPSEIGEVHIGGRKPITKALSQYHPDEYAKNEAIYSLPQLLKEAKIAKRNVPDSDYDYIKWHYLKTKINGKPSFLNIQEDTRTGVKAFYAITKTINK
jgi:hypothetical protein